LESLVFPWAAGGGCGALLGLTGAPVAGFLPSTTFTD